MPNQLINEQSPYLLQHAHNPVMWLPWGDAAFFLAKEKNMPVLVSIGYSACHWCHVMERESFEDNDTAAYMNDHFICIKVDREEHPDVDHFYMDAVQAISGSGGWPLNVFVTPDRIPFYGGTYFPPKPAYSRPSWMQLLDRMQTIWNTQNDEAMTQSGQMLEYLKQASAIAAKGNSVWNPAANDRMATTLLAMADKEWGGFGSAPKFPGTMAITYLQERAHFYKDEAAKAQALLSLDKMIDGGIYDHLNGGFSRYSTDREWLAPHFEKMLYDNALLVCALSDAFQITKHSKYAEIIDKTIAFANRELRDPGGLYYCALDADSEGVEGKFYTWSWEEFSELAGEHASLIAAHFGVVERGNWEHTNILHLKENIPSIAVRTGLSEAVISGYIETAKQALSKRQQQRIRPSTDDKSLLSWNALMNTALTHAGIALGNEAYLKQALQHMDLMLESYKAGNGLCHSWKSGVPRIPAKLDDYAYLIQALLQLASATGENQYLTIAAKWMDFVAANFSDEKGVFFFYTSIEQQDIPVRKVDIYDGATPSANAVMADSLMLLGMIMERRNWIDRSLEMLETVTDSAVRYPYSFGYWCMLLQRQLRQVKTAVISGKEGDNMLDNIHAHFLPDVFPVLFRSGFDENFPIGQEKLNSGDLAVFICTIHECKPPQGSIEAALAELMVP